MAKNDSTVPTQDAGADAKEEPTMITFYKTLVIGLGGTGREVCRLLKAFLFAESHGNLKKFNHVKILAIDSREREAPVDPQIFGLPPVDFDGDEEMTLTVEQDIDTNKYPWFDEGQKPMLRNLRGEGAGARRQVGRLILLENWSKVYDKIRFKVGELQTAEYNSDFKREWKDRVECKTDISIYVVGNLVSGTGSGMMLEMGYLINSIRDSYREVNSSIAITTMINKKYQDMGNRMINTVSALRELNHFYHEEIYGNLTTCFKIEAPTAPQKITYKKLSRMAPPYDRIFLTDLDSFANAPMEPEQAHYLISRFLYHQTGTHVGAHFRGKDVDDKGCTELDDEGNPLVCKSFGVMSVIDQKPTIDRRCAFRLAERVIQCISGEDNITIERLQKEGLNVPPPKKEYVPQSLEDNTKNFAEELRKEMQETLAVQFEEIKNTMAEVPTGIGIKHEDYLESLIKKTYAAFSKAKEKEFLLVLERSRNYMDQQFNEIRNQIRRRAYMKKSKDVSWKSLFDIIWEKIENKMFKISNVTIPQEEDFSGNLHSVERFLYYLTYERDNLLTNQINIINKDKGQYKTRSESLLGQFNNAETQMKSLYKQYFGKPALEQAIREFSVLARNYYRERLRHVIWERCSLILSGDPSESGEDERYQNGILNLSKQLYQKYRNAYRKVCTIDNWFGQAYLNEHIKTGGVGMLSLPAKTDEKTIYEQLLKNSEKIIGLIKRVLDDYANGVPQELGNISDEKEKELHDDLFQWCLEYVNEITDRPSFDEIFTEEVDLKEDLKEHLNRALPMIKFDANRKNETGTPNSPGYCTVSIPPQASTLQDYIKNHDTFKNTGPLFLERADTIYDVDLITATPPYNPSVSQRVQELCEFYNQEKSSKNLHLFTEYSLLALGGTDEQTQAGYDLAVAMGWLKINMDERTLKYYYFYESDMIEIDVGEQKETEVYNWKSRTNPIHDQLWKSIASKPRDPQAPASVTVLKDVLHRIRKEAEQDRDLFIKNLKEGVVKFLKGQLNLVYKDVKLGGEVALFNSFAELIARVTGKNPMDVHSWLKKKPAKKITPEEEPGKEVTGKIPGEEPGAVEAAVDESEFQLPPISGKVKNLEDMSEDEINGELEDVYLIKLGLSGEKWNELANKCSNVDIAKKINLIRLLRNLQRPTARKSDVIIFIKRKLRIDFALE